MKKNISTYIIAFFLPCIIQAQDPALKLWYNQPAQKWTDALPIGNGRLGAMIYGGINEEHIQFNESTLCTGRPRDYQRNGAYKYLGEIRSLLSQGKQKEAEQLAGDHFMGRKDVDDSVYVVQKKQWLDKITSNRSFAVENLDDSRWKTMQLPTFNGWETLEDFGGVDGAVWFRTSFNLPKELAGKNLKLDLGRIRDLDYTFINGQLVGSTEGISSKRSYIINANNLKEGKNVIAVQVINFFDKGGFTGIKEDRRIFVLYPPGADPAKGIALETNWKYSIQNDDPPQYPQYQASYQPFGDVFFEINDQAISNYKRELDISNAVSKVSYTSNGVNFTRTYFASAPDQTIVAHFTANKKKSINLSAFFTSPHKDYQLKNIDKKTIALFVKVKNGALKGVSYLHIETNGEVVIDAHTIFLKNADEATFYLTAATNFKNYKDVSADPEQICRSAIRQLNNKTYSNLESTHIKDYQQQFNSFSINLGSSLNSQLPTDERIKQFSPATDPALIALYVQYARYLMIASSHSSQPANLQGIWNDQLTPPWGSKYTTNINLEMNYWPADALNLSANTKPLFDMISDLAVAGRSTAKEHYAAPGWVLHHNTDIWRGTAPINASNHGIWVTGAAWLCHHIWDHYLFTQDKDFLRRYYPVMRSAADFFSSFLIKDTKTGWLISTPSNSPENGGLVAGPTMDHQIIRDLYKNCIAAAGILNTDVALQKTWEEKYKQIAPNQIGKYGQLQEWLQDIDDSSNKHRHVSHLWGLYPGTDITWKDTAMMNAAKQSLLFRGNDGTGWSLAWKTNLWARFKDGDHALTMLEKLLSSADDDGSASEKGGVYKNLFDAHPPFQIDGNFGGAAGVAEMLLQSHEDFIELFPALPAVLASGEVKGLCARGGFTINLKWSNGKLQQLSVVSNAGKECRLKYGNKAIRFSTQRGKTYNLNNDLQLL